MGLETATFINDLVSTNPDSSDKRKLGDDHLRLIKAALKSTFPNADRAQYFDRAVSKTADYTVLTSDNRKWIIGDTTSNDVSLTLPTLGTSNDGWCVTVVKAVADNTLVVAGTISGETNFDLDSQYDVAHFFWSGTAWFGFKEARTIGGVQTIASLATSVLEIPHGNTAGRPTPRSGLVYGNEQTNALDVYLNGAWKSLQPSLGRGYIDGFNLTNNASDVINDIDFSAGECRDAFNTFNIYATSMAGKQMDANWAPGPNAGLRYAGAGLTNTTYHYYVAVKLDGTTDFFADPSADEATALAHLQAQTGGADFVFIRYIQSLRRVSNVMQRITQRGDYVEFLIPQVELSGIGLLTGSRQTIDLPNIPSGIVLRANLTLLQVGNGDQVYLSALTQADQAPTPNGAPLFSAGASSSSNAVGTKDVWTNTSAQIGGRSNDATSLITIVSNGFYNPRGRNK